jgi:hypothetical protein
MIWGCMRTSSFLPTREATPEQILAVLRDVARHQEILDPDVSEIELSMDTTVAQWRAACGLLQWRALSVALERRFELNVPDSEWERALEPSSQRTLGDVCVLVSRHVRLPELQPWPIAGTQSTSAGAFLILRTLLHRAGVPVGELAPSTPLAPLLQSHPIEILTVGGLLAPGRLPTVALSSSWWERLLLRPGQVALPGLTTFGDLAESLASPEDAQ